MQEDFRWGWGQGEAIFDKEDPEVRRWVAEVEYYDKGKVVKVLWTRANKGSGDRAEARCRHTNSGMENDWAKSSRGPRA